jgi:hypothetical protein
MKNAWLSYLGSVLIIVAGILMLAGRSTVSGIVLIVAGIGGIVAKFILSGKSKS